MGNHFLMSMRFNKINPQDFGLIPSNNPGVLLKPEDGSQWKARPLYDFGWGKENGYYKIPLPDFNRLVAIILRSKDDEDRYGAAAIILDDYYEELLHKCLRLFENNEATVRYNDFFRILRLDTPLNRSSVIGKHYSRISDDYSKWKALARWVNNILMQ